jgi:hypothetical protein
MGNVIEGMATVEEFRAEQEAERQAIANVTIGDLWFRYVRFDALTLEVTVTKVTKTQVTFSNGERMARASSTLIGGSKFNQVHFRPATEALRTQRAERIQNHALNNELSEAVNLVQCSLRNLSPERKAELLKLLKGFINTL